MKPAPPLDPADLADYRDENARALSQALIVLTVVGGLGVPGGFLLDYFVYRPHFLEFLAVRLATPVLLAGVLAGIYLAGKARHTGWLNVLGILSGLIMNAAMSFMIYRTDGAASPYFVGLVLVLMSWSVVAPWRVLQTLLLCGGSLLIYLAACIGNPGFGPAAYGLLGFGGFFLVLTAAVGGAMTFYLSRVRRNDFLLRHQLDRQNRELQDLDRAKTQFFSNVSHELRTPLTLILSPVEDLLARGDALEARVHESLILVHRNSLRLLKLINDLLDLTRLDQGGETLRRQTFPAGPFVRGIVDSVRHLGLAKNLRLRVEEGDAGALLTADPARIEKVLVNLLTNAIKYTPAGGAISVSWQEAGTDTTLTVHDTGVGIPAEDLSRIFDRFHQVRSNVTNQTQGVGIGLALVRELVEEHGGRIEVESRPGEGSTFRVHLPRAADGPVSVEPMTGAADEEPFARAFRSADRAVRPTARADDDLPPTLGHGESTVLVADDEPDMRQFITGLLADDYRVVQTHHGANVAALAEEHLPDLVLLDWMMPGRDGLTVCRELRASPAHADTKIMLLTARIDEPSKLEALAAGADDFLTKPFSSAEVKNRVANLIRAARLQRDLRARNDDLRATLEKLQRTEAMLIQSEKMNAIGSLSAGLLHEINNPLNYTLTAISLTHRLRDSLSPDLRELLADIEEGMARIRDVVTDLRTFAHPEAPDSRSVFPLLEVVRAAQKIAGGELQNITVDHDIPADLLLEGRRTQLTHVFINLFDNAAKALAEAPPKDPARIRITAVADGDRVTIAFADNGPGIPAAIRTRVFDPFFTTRDVGGGMGLGLSICHTIMQSHHGSIRLGADAAGGALFELQLPTAQAAIASC